MYLPKFLKGVFGDPTIPEPIWEGSLGVVPVIDVERLYVEGDIKEQQGHLAELQEAEDHLISRVNEYGNALDRALEEELAEYKRLENELAAKEGKDAPFEEPKSKEEQIEDAVNQANDREQKKYTMDLSPDKVDARVHKLYKKYAKIYHPDKASEEDKEYFNEVFQMLNHYKMLNDYRGLKEFCKKLRKKTRMEVVTAIEDLKTFLNELREEVSALRRKCTKLIDDPVQERADDYYANPELHIMKARDSLQGRINLLRKKLESTPTFGGSLWG